MSTVQSTSTLAGGTATNAVITKPTGLAAGDLMVAHLVLGDATATYATPSGWTVAGTAQRSNVTYQTIMYKIADSADAAATDFTFTIGTSEPRAGAILRISGFNPVQPIDSIYSGAAENTVSPSFATGLTPTHASSLLIMFTSNNVGRNVSSQAIATSNPSWTEAYDMTDGSFGGFACAYATRTEVTALGDGSFTNDSGSGVEDNGIHLVIIRELVNATVSPAVITSAGAVQAPAIAGGATISASVITSSGTVQTPSRTDQADWSAQGKSTSGTWTAQSKS